MNGSTNVRVNCRALISSKVKEDDAITGLKDASDRALSGQKIRQ